MLDTWTVNVPTNITHVVLGKLLTPDLHTHTCTCTHTHTHTHPHTHTHAHTLLYHVSIHQYEISKEMKKAEKIANSKLHTVRQSSQCSRFWPWIMHSFSELPTSAMPPTVQSPTSHKQIHKTTTTKPLQFHSIYPSTRTTQKRKTWKHTEWNQRNIAVLSSTCSLRLRTQPSSTSVPSVNKSTDPDQSVTHSSNQRHERVGGGGGRAGGSVYAWGVGGRGR